MTIETITVFRAGAFTTEPAPDWLQRVNGLAERDVMDWDIAARKVLGDAGWVTEIQDHGGVAVQVNEWATRAVGGTLSSATFVGRSPRSGSPIIPPPGFRSTSATLLRSWGHTPRWRSPANWTASATA